MGAEHVQVRRVLPPVLDVFESGAAAEEIVGDVEPVIGFPIRQVKFQHGNGIEGGVKAGPKDDLMNQRQAPVGDGLCFFSELINDGSLCQLRLAEAGLGSIRSKIDLGLAIFNHFVYCCVHLKSFPWLVVTKTFSAIDAGKQGGFQIFSFKNVKFSLD